MQKSIFCLLLLLLLLFFTQTEKRKNPGQSDETHTLAEKIEPDKKKLKTMIHSKEKLPEDDNVEEGMEVDEKGDPDICQHVKETEQFDHYAMDAATEEQSKEQASNIAQEKDMPTEEEVMDVDMHEDEVEVVEDETVLKQKPDKLSEEDSSNNKKDSKEKGKLLILITIIHNKNLFLQIFKFSVNTYVLTIFFFYEF